jgi:DNA-binding XRE family transcriptional regulator
MSQQLRQPLPVMYPEEEYVRRRICEAIDGLTNAAAARLLGVSHETIRRIRIGDPPSLRLVISVCREMKIDPRWLVMGESITVARKGL